jgi:serine/threonine protein kinase
MQKIGKYEILGAIGRGAMGLVYKGQDLDIGRIVAIKTLRKLSEKDNSNIEKVLTRFKTEARAAGKLRHPNIITIFEASIENEIPYIVMDFVDGSSLDKILLAQGVFSLSIVANIIKQLASALDYAHSQGVIHRDLKPANLVMDPKSNVYILDFGIAYLDSTFTQDFYNKQKTTAGTPGYMSPEQILNKELDARSDLFSLAVVTFELLTGRKPYKGKDFREISENVLKSEPEDIEKYISTGGALGEFFKKALARERNNRFSNANEFYEELIKITYTNEAIEKNNIDRTAVEQNWKSLKINTKTLTRNGSVLKDVVNQPKISIQQQTSTFYSNVADDTLMDKNKKNKTNLTKYLIMFITVFISVVGLYVYTKSSPPITNYKSVTDQVEDSKADTPNNQLSPEIVTPVQIDNETNRLLTEVTETDLVQNIINTESSDKIIIESINELERRNLSSLIENNIALLLSHDSMDVRIETMKLIGRLKLGSASSELLVMLDDFDPNVRKSAAQVLGELGSRKSLAYLNARLQTEEIPQVKDAIVNAISQINGF